MFITDDNNIYNAKSIHIVIRKVKETAKIIKNNKQESFYNIPCAFDIETSSFYNDHGKIVTQDEKMKRAEKDSTYNPRKIAIMYVWQMDINGLIVMGRTWHEFIYVCSELSSKLDLSVKKRLVVYVHNLSYEFQFIRKRFTWDKVFAIDNRSPVYAITDTGIEFRCSYYLSGYSLAKLGDNLNKYPVKKMVGDLDYKLIRNSKTPLSVKEIRYCINDVKVVVSYIQEMIDDNKGITKIPLTKTGIVRRYCRKKCLYTEKHKINYKYKDLMNRLTLNGMEEFNLLHSAFQGGFTHASAFHVNDICKNVGSIDFTSSYPAVMICEKYPMSKGRKVVISSKEEFQKVRKQYGMVFAVTFYHLQPKLEQDNPISYSHSVIKGHYVTNNGRVVSADELSTVCTNIDFTVYEYFYKWDAVKIGLCYVYQMDYLPKELVESIVTLYENKTTLKGVIGKEVEYLHSKEQLNSVYGMSVTSPVRDEYHYENSEWLSSKLDNEGKNEAIKKYNEGKKRFLFYPWGVFVTAYARRNLFSGIMAFGYDYIYSDTDSIKGFNFEKHKDYIEQYNRMDEEKLKMACKAQGIDFKRVKPKTIKGKEKLIGVWDYEGEYKRFKTLGAKRYMVEKDDVLRVDGKSYDLSLTVSGVNKFKAIPYLKEHYKDNTEIFNEFSDGMYINPLECGKNLHTYIDEERSGYVTDYLGNVAKYDELSSIHLEGTSYTMNLTEMYLRYLMGVKHDRTY